MANYPFLYRGFDPTSVVGTPTNSQLLQMIAEAKPTFKQAGMFVISSTAPNVVTYPDLAFAIWLELNLGGTALTGNQYYYNGTTWVAIPLPAGAVTNDSIANNTIQIGKLSVTGGAADQIIAVNAGATAFEFTTVVSKIANGSLAFNKLAPPAAGQILYGVGTTWTLYSFSTLFAAELAISDIPINTVTDTTNAYLAGQVPAIAASGDALQPYYVESLLRNNQTPTQKLNLGGVANAGKVLTVNAAGTDIEYQTAATTKIAIVAFTGAAGTLPDQTIAGTAKTLSWAAASEVDPGSLITLAANKITFAATGYYLLDIVVPFKTAGASMKGRVYLYDVTAAAEVSGMNKPFYNYASGDSQDGLEVTAKFLINVADAAHEYEVRCKTDDAAYLSFWGAAVNYDGGVERYQQMTITKIG